jgi:hypothetical protein
MFNYLTYMSVLLAKHVAMTTSAVRSESYTIFCFLQQRKTLVFIPLVFKRIRSSMKSNNTNNISNNKHGYHNMAPVVLHMQESATNTALVIEGSGNGCN